MSYINVLFWNVQKKNLTPQIVNLAHNRGIDILVLAENPVSSVQLIQALNTTGPHYFQNHPLSQCKKITIITKFHYNSIAPIEETARLTIRHIHLPTGEDFLLTALHLVDKGNFTAESQNEAASLTADQLIRVENRLQFDRHIVLGDFNMNPFETGMIKANGFHGTMSSEVASLGYRTVQTREYPYFYNPTWSLFGDLNKDVSGTYYYKHAEHVCYEWNVFDQVLIRPRLVPNFVKDSLEIIQTDGVTSLITTRNTPNQSTYSDHLPLFFTLKF
ncbi:endonuclease/exonuclease/phosphatase family protein [Spirosoma foliorum]|uniref:Endonuclease/exonuclease/phosphatase family protein n=1 Tax=Spirosoma foliorum TaxID=2710596 RepID=A0A7G5H7X3_9BACT|nr:endonuclease/exonuclease/phosphatase family protein [Spirosoma foliorum]QMW07215.1 endonuclease/exonuclease/phosphatase family protein [Spirosoma foliorum]